MLMQIFVFYGLLLFSSKKEMQVSYPKIRIQKGYKKRQPTRSVRSNYKKLASSSLRYNYTRRSLQIVEVQKSIQLFQVCYLADPLNIFSWHLYN